MTDVSELRHHPVWPLVLSLARLENARRVADASSHLGVAERRLLWLFADGRPRTMRETADEVGLDLSTVSRQVARALESGIVERRRGPGESSPRLRATATGAELLARDLEWHIALHQKALDAVPAPERERFTGWLAAFSETYARTAAERDQLTGGDS